MFNTKMDTLPDISAHPIRYPQSCACISLPLLAFLNNVLPHPPCLTLSVGSGSGLLEATLLKQYPARAGAIPVSFLGIEVTTAEGSQPVNRFLPEPNVVTVPGTWAVVGELVEAEALLFVYARQSGLIQKYLEAGKKVETVVWIGPRCDLEEMTGPLRDWGVEMQREDSEGELVEEGEAVLVFRRRDGGS